LTRGRIRDTMDAGMAGTGVMGIGAARLCLISYCAAGFAPAVLGVLLVRVV
jgi:hypothetical protein